MKDFENWYEWCLRALGYVERYKALEFYKEIYSCDCVSCEYRKTQGQIPVKQNLACKLSLHPETDLENKVKEWLKDEHT